MSVETVSVPPKVNIASSQSVVEVELEVPPLWVTSPVEFFGYPVGVGCETVKRDDLADELRAKELAIELATLDLFKSLGGEQLLSASEILAGSEDSVTYDVRITRKIHGQIGRNKVVKKGVVSFGERKKYCIAIAEI